MKTIELTHSSMIGFTSKDILAFSFAESGAMGEPGAVILVDKDKQFYHCNYVFGDVTEDDVLKMVPMLQDCQFGLFGRNSIVPAGWTYVNLGMGNHLVVSNEVYKSFSKRMERFTTPPQIYQNWRSAFFHSIGKRHAAIINFQSPVELDDLIDRFRGDQLTNIDHIFKFEDTLGEWTVDRYSEMGDIVFFMCAKTSKDHMGHVCAQAKKTEDEELIAYAESERALYKKYAGKILAVGAIMEDPFQTDNSGYEYQYWRNNWYARIGNYQLLKDPIDISDYRDYITVSRTGSITKLDIEQERKLITQIKSRNPEIEI